MSTFETQDRPWNGPGLSPLERQMATYLDVEIVNARRRSSREFDVELDYIATGEEGSTGWMPLVLLHEEWKRRPMEIGRLVEAAGGRATEKCTQDWDYVRSLDDDEKFMAMCHGIWALAQARIKQ
jgi:hypothetical protein